MNYRLLKNQFCSVENPKEEEVADDGSGYLVCTYAAHALCLSAAMVCPHFSPKSMACSIHSVVHAHFV